MLGDIIYEQKGTISTIEFQIQKVQQQRLPGTGFINGIEVTDIVTYCSKPSKDSDGKTFSAEGQGIISTHDGELISWKGYGIGR